jgi:undecaprenyl-diphosphatase
VNLLSCIVVIIVARCLANLLPFRERPLQTTGLGFRLPHTIDVNTLIHWSSFPSDHAAMFYASATGLLFVERRMGVLALAYVSLVICLPRIYLGLHYPTDIMAGAMIGVGIAAMAEATVGRHWRGKWFTSFQIATLFDDIRAIGRFMVSWWGH